MPRDAHLMMFVQLKTSKIFSSDIDKILISKSQKNKHCNMLMTTMTWVELLRFRKLLMKKKILKKKKKFLELRVHNWILPQTQETNCQLFLLQNHQMHQLHRQFKEKLLLIIIFCLLSQLNNSHKKTEKVNS